MNEGIVCGKLNVNGDKRGFFAEVQRWWGVSQFSYSVTKEGETRGNHYHKRKSERFVVVQGNGIVRLREVGSGKVLSFVLDGRDPMFVDIPRGYVHNISNAGKGDLITLFWTDEFYDESDADTYYEIV